MCVCVYAHRSVYLSWYSCKGQRTTSDISSCLLTCFETVPFCLFFMACVGHVSWPASLPESRSCLSHCHWSATRITDMCCHTSFLWVLGIWTQVLCLCGKPFTCRAVSPREKDTFWRELCHKPSSLSCFVYTDSLFSYPFKSNKLPTLLSRYQLGSGVLIKTTRNLNFVIDISDRRFL